MPETENTVDLTGLRSTQSEIGNADYRAIDLNLLSPMFQHFVEVKEQYPHALLLYRVGDFFETFFEDAITIARELELVITSKEGGQKVGRVPMTGVPHHAVERYSASLVEKGYAVAICDQMEDDRNVPPSAPHQRNSVFPRFKPASGIGRRARSLSGHRGNAGGIGGILVAARRLFMTACGID